MLSHIAPTPRPPRASSCHRLAVADLRPLLEPGATTYLLGETELELAWQPVRGCFGGQLGRSLVAACPRCSRPVRVLWRPPGEGWACSSCHRISHPSHRRSGSQRGRPKPASWWREQIAAEQQRAAALLGIAWPPPQLIWSRADLAAAPRLPGAARLSAERREALLDRLDALEDLRIGQVLPGLATSELGLRLPPAAELELVDTAARAALSATRWAIRRPARDRRTLQGRWNPPGSLIRH